MSSEYRIKISDEFSEEPYGRYPRHGNYNGERFREQFLVPALGSHDKVIVNLDDTWGMGSSFLEEAFGGLVRIGYFQFQDLEQRLVIEDKENYDKVRARGYMRDAEFEEDFNHKEEMDKTYRK